VLRINRIAEEVMKEEDVEIIDTCANGREAIRKIKTEKPDLVFLDIQMPGFDGFSVVKGVMDIEPPLFVFVTAYEEHAIRAFEANAVNYLMKPVDEQKLADTIERVRQRLAEKKSAEDAEQLLDVLNEVAPERAADFVADDDAAHGGGDHHVDARAHVGRDAGHHRFGEACGARAGCAPNAPLLLPAFEVTRDLEDL
jgi:two-component system LytT family response regulator